MSETLAQLKEIKGLLASIIGVVVGCIIVGGLLMEWRIEVNVAAQLANQDIGTDAKIISMDDDIDDAKSLANAAQASATANATRIDGNERRVEQAFQAFWDIIKAKPTE